MRKFNAIYFPLSDVEIGIRLSLESFKYSFE